MDLLELTELLRQGEGEKIEFKTNADTSVGKVVCAFLNTDGGKVVIGVADNGRIVGCAKDTEEKIANLISAIYPRPSVKIEKLEVEKKKVITIFAHQSDKLHSFGNIGYIRIGSTTRELQLDEVIEKAAESLLIRFDEAQCLEATESDLSKEILNTYLQRRREVRAVQEPRANDKTLWEMARAMNKQSITNAGILFFCNYPEKFHPQAQVRFIEFRGVDMQETLEEKNFSGNIWRVSDDVSAFLEKKIPYETRLKNFEKITSSRFPLEALREAINNALIHRNYFESADIRIFLFNDRIEIINPGSFPPDVTPETPAHRPRNALLSQYFYDIGKIEKYGAGLIKMRQLCRENGYPGPVFQLKGRQTKVIFYFMPLKIREAIKETDEIGRKILEEINQGKNKSGQLLKIIPLARDSLVARLNKLIEKKVLVKKGKGRNTYYEFA